MSSESDRALVDYTSLSHAQVAAALDAIARDARSTFGSLDAVALNWRPDATRWSVAQCLEHLLMTNRLMQRAGEDALTHARPRTVWERLPVWSRIFGRMLIRSQAPTATRKFVTSSVAQPTSSDIAPDVVQRFVAQHGELVAWIEQLDEQRMARTVMTSPFAAFITYTVLDGCRLVVAHDHRHSQQARRVMQSTGFPASSTRGSYL